MNVVYDLDRVAEWLREQVCKDIKRKPHDPADQAVEVENYELVEPSVFALYIPTNETKPPNVIATVPGICVQIIDGNDDLVAQNRSYKLRLSFATWDPGTHDRDVFHPQKNEEPGQVSWRYVQGEGNGVTLNHEGWRDVWNLVDHALHVIESAERIGGLPIDRKAGVKFGTFPQDDGLADYYPFWQAWVELTLTGDNRRRRPEVEKYL